MLAQLDTTTSSSKVDVIGQSSWSLDKNVPTATMWRRVSSGFLVYDDSSYVVNVVRHENW